MIKNQIYLKIHYCKKVIKRYDKPLLHIRYIALI